MLSNECLYMVANIGFDTAEIEPSKIWGICLPPTPSPSLSSQINNDENWSAGRFARIQCEGQSVSSQSNLPPRQKRCATEHTHTLSHKHKSHAIDLFRNAPSGTTQNVHFGYILFVNFFCFFCFFLFFRKMRAPRGGPPDVGAPRCALQEDRLFEK